MINRFLSAIILGAAPVWAVSFPLQVSMTNSTLLPKSPLILQIHGPDARGLKTQILDSDGNRVAELQPTTDHELLWDGRDGKGRMVPPGTYMVEIVDEPYLWDGAVTVAK